jgi:hypothetical protein
MTYLFDYVLLLFVITFIGFGFQVLNSSEAINLQNNIQVFLK